MERFVAIDNVCAWPNLTKLRDGLLVATIFNQPCHGSWEGDVECWGSRDGRFWSKLGTPAPHEPGTNRMNVAAGEVGDGSLVVLSSGWSHRPVPPNPMPMRPIDPTPPAFAALSNTSQAQILSPWVCRSSDGGRTWTRSETVHAPAEMAVLIPFGDILLDPDGHPCTTFYGWDVDSTRKTGGRHSWFFRSRDDGHTWEPVSVIGPDNYNETTLLHLGGGRWLAVARTNDGHLTGTQGRKHLDLFASEDNGATWQLRGPVTMPAQIPGHLMRLADGRLLLHYGVRNPDSHGLGIRYSSDEGKTWTTPRMLLEYDRLLPPGSPSIDGGYPSCVQLDDGMLVTVYYAASCTSHTRYHMGAIRWMPTEG